MEQQPVQELLKIKRISEIPHAKLVQAPSETSIEAAVALMQAHRSGYLLVSDHGKATGIFTETDYVRKVLGRPVDWSAPVRDVMTANPVVLKPSDSIGTAVALMGTHRFYHLPLVDDQAGVVGMLSVRSLIRFLAEFYPAEVYNLPPDTSQIMKTPEGG